MRGGVILVSNDVELNNDQVELILVPNDGFQKCLSEVGVVFSPCQNIDPRTYPVKQMTSFYILFFLKN